MSSSFDSTKEPPCAGACACEAATEWDRWVVTPLAARGSLLMAIVGRDDWRLGASTLPVATQFKNHDLFTAELL